MSPPHFHLILKFKINIILSISHSAFQCHASIKLFIVTEMVNASLRENQDQFGRCISPVAAVCVPRFLVFLNYDQHIVYGVNHVGVPGRAFDAFYSIVLFTIAQILFPYPLFKKTDIRSLRPCVQAS